MVSAPLITHDLSFGYGKVPVLRDLNAVFPPGGFHAIVGPNGSGKSTLLGLLAGHLTPESGTISLGDENLFDLKPGKLAQRMALVPQSTTFSFPFTVFDTVLMGRHPHIPRFARPSNDDLQMVRQALSVMDLHGLADRTIPELSGGERQRTVFARALAQDTPCLLLDEPTSSMDIRHTLAAMAHLRDLAHKGERTVVAVLHDLNLAANHCDSVTILKDGVVHATGSPDATLTPEIINAVFGVTAHIVRDGRDAPHLIHYEP